MENGEKLMVFARFPEKGAVKTRLGRAIGEESAADLYQCFVLDTLALCREAGYVPSIFFHPPEARGAMMEWLGGELACEAQEGDSLGERMYAAFQRAFRSFRRAVLIGTDIPDLPAGFLREAFRTLRNRDAVIGPARDGGYYLIGFSSESLSPALFNGLPWGSSTVFSLTVRLLEAHGLRFGLLPEWHDVDEYEDLTAFFDRWKDLPPGRLATVDYLRAHGW